MSATASSALAELQGRMAAGIEARLPPHIERLGWDAPRLRAHQQAALRGLLAHALERSPFHRRRLGAVDPEAFTPAGLASLPVMTKADLMAEWDEVVTDPRLTAALVEAHLAGSATEPSALLGEYVCLASGGGSGLRGMFVQSVEEYVEFGATILRRGMARLRAAGGPPPGGLLMGMVAAPSPVHSTAFGAATVAGGPVRFASIPATLPLAEIVARLNELQPPALMGFATTLARLAAEQRAGRLAIPPLVVTSTSEMLSAEDRAAIEEAFGVPVVDQFAATEGLVGHSDPGGRVLTFASDTCLAEVLGDGRVLVTNLYNRTQPLIRYELGDRFVPHPPEAGSGFLRAEVEGRADEGFRYGEAVIHPLVVRTVMVKTPAVREYQVSQTLRGIEAAVVAGAELDERALRAGLRDALAAAGVPEPEVVVRAVDVIPRHPETGKARRFVPLAG